MMFLSRRAFSGLIMLPFVLAACLSIVRAIRFVPIPYELGYGEGLVLWQAAHITRLNEVYHPINIYPFVVCMYPPVFQMLSRIAGWLVGDLQVGARCVAILAFFGIIALAGALARAGMQSKFDSMARWTAALVSGGVAATVSSVRNFVPSARADGLGLFFTLTGLLLFTTAGEKRRMQYFAFVCFILALFTKQTLVAAPIACLITGAIIDRKRALQIGLFAGFCGLIPLLLLNWLTKNQFIPHLFLYTRNTFSVRQAIFFLVRNLRDMLPLIVALGAMGISAVHDRRSHYRWNLQAIRAELVTDKRRAALFTFVVYMFCALAVSATCGKAGAAEYYFMEWNVACGILTGISLGFLIGRWQEAAGSWITVSAGAAVCLFAILAIGKTVNPALRLTAGAHRLDAAQSDEFNRALQIVQHTPGPVFAYDLTLLLKAGKEVPLEPFMLFDLAKSGRWDERPFVQQLLQHYYTAIVAESDVVADNSVPATVRNAIATAYVPAERIGKYTIYRPAGGQLLN